MGTNFLLKPVVTGWGIFVLNSEGRFRLDNKQDIFFMMQIVKHCNRLSRKVIVASSLETFKVTMEMDSEQPDVVGDVSAHCRGDWLDYRPLNIPANLNSSVILWNVRIRSSHQWTMPNLSSPHSQGWQDSCAHSTRRFFAFSSLFHSFYVWCWMFDVGDPSARSICPFGTLDLHQSSLCKCIWLWILWWLFCIIPGTFTVSPSRTLHAMVQTWQWAPS